MPRNLAKVEAVYGLEVSGAPPLLALSEIKLGAKRSRGEFFGGAGSTIFPAPNAFTVIADD